MATFARTNPVATTVNYEVVGKDISFFTVDYINAINGSVGPEGAHQAVLKVIMQQHTIIAAGPLLDTNTQQTFAIEGPVYTPQGGTAATGGDTLQARIRALGTVDGVNLSNATVTETKLGILTAAAVA
jgi:hypothetical protein